MAAQSAEAGKRGSNPQPKIFVSVYSEVENDSHKIVRSGSNPLTDTKAR